MSKKRIVTAVAAVLALASGVEGTALAASPPLTTSSTTHSARAARQSAHAWLRLDVGRAKGWVGQAVPVTVTAYFRDAEGVTLEGAPQIVSDGIFTADLAREPRQATQMIGGEPVVAATWTGTVTPSTSGNLTLSAELPVDVRYRDAAPQNVAPTPFGADPFDALAADPFDMGAIDRFFQQSMQRAVQGAAGRARDEAVSLRTSVKTIDIMDPPTAGQPPSFSGAIGRYDLKATLSSSTAQVSEPVTLRVVVEGDGDLDRVDLAGVATSSDWKAYPPKATTAPASKGRRASKVFEQVLIPLHGGALSVPVVSLTSFDPGTERYVTTASSPLVVDVAGGAPTAAAEPIPSASSQSTPAALAPAPPSNGTWFDLPRLVAPSRTAIAIGLLILLLVAAGLVIRARRRAEGPSLRRTMRAAAVRGDVVPFFGAAHAYIASALARRYGIAREAVNAAFIRERLGPDGDALVETLAADEALRFGRRTAAAVDLAPLCSSIERSVRRAA